MTQNTPKIILHAPEGASNRTGLFNQIVGKIGYEGTFVLGAVAIMGGLAVGKAALEKFDEIGLDTREGHYHEVMPKEYLGRHQENLGCAAKSDGSYGVFSRTTGLEVENVKAQFDLVRLTDDPMALGSCDVSVTNDNGQIVDEYKVEAFPLPLLARNL